MCSQISILRHLVSPHPSWWTWPGSLYKIHSFLLILLTSQLRHFLRFLDLDVAHSTFPHGCLLGTSKSTCPVPSNLAPVLKMVLLPECGRCLFVTPDAPPAPSSLSTSVAHSPPSSWETPQDVSPDPTVCPKGAFMHWNHVVNAYKLCILKMLTLWITPAQRKFLVKYFNLFRKKKFPAGFIWFSPLLNVIPPYYLLISHLFNNPFKHLYSKHWLLTEMPRGGCCQTLGVTAVPGVGRPPGSERGVYHHEIGALPEKLCCTPWNPLL